MKWSGKEFSLPFGPTTTVLELKQLLRDKTNVNPERQKLLVLNLHALLRLLACVYSCTHASTLPSKLNYTIAHCRLAHNMLTRFRFQTHQPQLCVVYSKDEEPDPVCTQVKTTEGKPADDAALVSKLNVKPGAKVMMMGTPEVDIKATEDAAFAAPEVQVGSLHGLLRIEVAFFFSRCRECFTAYVVLSFLF